MYAPTSTNSPRSGPTSGDDDGLTDFDGAGEILRAWGNGLRPDPDLTVSEWADRHRMLSGRASAEPGRYRTVRTLAQAARIKIAQITETLAAAFDQKLSKIAQIAIDRRC